MPWAFLLALQAAGMTIDWFGKRQQVAMGRMGAKIEQAGIDANVAMNRLEAEDASLQAMKQLRMTLGSQAAIQAARGTNAGVGSALMVGRESESNFNSDERVRRMNLLGREASLKAGKAISSLHQDANEAEIWSQFRTSAFDKIGTAAIGYKAGGVAGAAKSTYGFKPV